MANVGPIGNVMTTSLNQEQKKRAAGVMAIFNVILGSVPAPPIYGLILDRWGEYNKHCAMIAYKNYLYFSIPLIIFAILIRKHRFKNEDESFILDEKTEEVEYSEPLEDFVDDYKIKISNEENKDIEMKNI